MLRRLTKEAELQRASFDSEYPFGQGCCCHINPPCGYCTHPGNPINQEEDDFCWEPFPIADLYLTQEGFRHSKEHVKSMIEFAKNGGRFDSDSLKKFDPHRVNLIAITKFEDGSFYVRDGFHRVVSIYLGRSEKFLYDDEYFIENLTFKRMMTPNLDLKYFTPFDPRVEVRAADFQNFRDQVQSVIDRQEDPIDFINKNRHAYVRPKIFDTVSDFGDYWRQHEFA